MRHPAKPPLVEVETFDLCYIPIGGSVGPNGGKVRITKAQPKTRKSVLLDSGWADMVIWECGCEDVLEITKGKTYITMRTACGPAHELLEGTNENEKEDETDQTCTNRSNGNHG